VVADKARSVIAERIYTIDAYPMHKAELGAAVRLERARATYLNAAPSKGDAPREAGVITLLDAARP